MLSYYLLLLSPSCLLSENKFQPSPLSLSPEIYRRKSSLIPPGIKVSPVTTSPFAYCLQEKLWLRYHLVLEYVLYLLSAIEIKKHLCYDTT
jgi:hypothetical protein